MLVMENSTLPIQRLRALLQMEYEAEREEYRMQLEQMSVERKVRRGICWWPLSVGRSYYNSLNQLVVEVWKTTDDDIDHSFEYGRPVVFFTPEKILPHTCTISYVEDDRMVVAVGISQALIDIQNAEQLGVQLYFDETSYRTMFSALDDVVNAKKNRLAQLRELFAGQLKPEKYRQKQMITNPTKRNKSELI